MSEEKDIRNDPIFREVVIHLNRMILLVELRLKQIERNLNISSANELEFIASELITIDIARDEKKELGENNQN